MAKRRSEDLEKQATPDETKKVRTVHLTVPVETVQQMEKIKETIGLSKEDLAILVMRAQKKGII